jgi:RNA polymerase sigma-70 factor, ECF subfamily
MRTERSDEELLLLYQRGSRDAFEELFARHHRRVINFCYRMTGDRARAEEAAQETFLRVARAAFTWQPTAKFTTWMYQIARRATLNVLRDEREQGEKMTIPVGDAHADGSASPSLAGPETEHPDRMAWSAQLQERILNALQTLPEGHRTAFVLCVGEGLSYQEAAAVLGITVQAVKSRIFRAREMLMERLSGILA